MSVAAIAARVAEIQGLLQRATTPPAAAGSFGAVLQTAQATPVVPAGTTVDGTTASSATPAPGAPTGAAAASAFSWRRASSGVGRSAA